MSRELKDSFQDWSIGGNVCETDHTGWLQRPDHPTQNCHAKADGLREASAKESNCRLCELILASGRWLLEFFISKIILRNCIRWYEIKDDRSQLTVQPNLVNESRVIRRLNRQSSLEDEFTIRSFK